MSLERRIRRGAQWLVAGKAGVQLVYFGSGIILARLLTPGDFGMVVTLQIFTGLAGFIASGGTGQALVQAKVVDETDFQVVFTLQFLIGLLIFFGFFLAAPAFAAHFGHPLYRDLLRISAVQFLMRPFVNLSGARLQRQMRFREQSLAGIAALLAAAATGIALAAAGFGVWSLILSGIASGIVEIAILMYHSRWRPRFRYRQRTVRTFGRYGALVSLNELAGYFRNQTSNFIITILMGAESVGLFNKGVSLSQMPADLLSGSCYKAVFRGLAEVQDDPARSRHLYLRTITWLAVAALPVYLGLYWLAEPFVVGVFGESWGRSAPVLQIFCLAGLLRVLEYPCAAAAAARKRLRSYLAVQVESFLLIAVACLLAWPHGLAGISLALLGVAAYGGLRMLTLVSRDLAVSRAAWVTALEPALVLNGLLLLLLLGLDLAVAAAGVSLSNGQQLAVYGGSGAGFYALLFLFMPLAGIAEEAANWRRRLRALLFPPAPP